MASPTVSAEKPLSNQLVDVVIFAFGTCEEMLPLTLSATQKAMLPICNRPLLWYCLAPLIDAGFKTFYLCVDEDYAAIDTYIRRVFGNEYQFHFVVVSPVFEHNEDGEEVHHKATTAAAVKEFLQFKNQLRDQHAAASSTRATQHDDPNRSPKKRSSAASRFHSNEKPAAAAIMELENRDALLLHCDTVLSKVDIEGFLKNFYVSLSSVTMMLMKPIDSPTSPYFKMEKAAAAAAASSAGQGKGGSSAKPSKERQLRSFQYNYSCVVYEEEEEIQRQLNQSICSSNTAAVPVIDNAGFLTPLTAANNSGSNFTRGVSSPTVMAPGSFAIAPPSPPSVPQVNTVEPYRPHHHRLHMLAPVSDELELMVTMPYAAKRPNLRFERGVIDPHVYLVRHWVLQYIAEFSSANSEKKDNTVSVEKEIIPTLARSQHSVINKAKKTFIAPDQRIGFTIPVHWFFQGKGRERIEVLNASYNSFFPEKGDSVRVSAVVYEEHPMSLRRIYRVHTPHNFMAANEEVAAARAAANNFHTTLMFPASPPGMSSTSASGFAGKAVGGNKKLSNKVGGEGSRSGSPHQSNHLPTGEADAEAVKRQRIAQQLTPFASTTFPFRQQALSLLLPDLAINLQCKIGSQGMYVQDSFVRSVIPPNTYVTRSIIGTDVKIQPGARITDSVLMYGVEVGKGAELNRCFIGNSAVISDTVKLVNCVVQSSFEVKKDAENESM